MQPQATNPAFDSTLVRWASAFLHLLAVSLRRLFWSRQTVVCAMLLVFASIAVVAWSMRRERTPEDFIEEIFLAVFVTFLLPIYSLCYGTAGIASEREERTLVYLLVSPLPRPLVFLAKGFASMILALVWTAGGLTIMCLLGGPAGREAWLPLLPAIFWSTIGYVSLFLLFSVQFRRATIIALGYALFVETLLGNMPGIAKRLAVSFYAKCLIFDAGAEFGASPIQPGEADLFAGISGAAALQCLYLLIAAFLVVGAIVFSRREYAN